ncbi:AimR family lysis-lysogeny pheromone receptor [Bacillus cereus]|uniref:AimR family lysis-lysogeny pheromone receptor n=1 Tax=Bacillus paranthracis TaxID=2026186 RepID=UPI00254D0270|nr:AimR family lysis-lysogeny pheromone receptor [Bacillus paranthracis]MDK7418700.1 AimR family lysis-lysogeny pheromone receptor [Bacillus paranthracis]MDK7432643.1 AimR family lysis-lysogeny pheromone receptor [Bacillus paranthracis]MDK7440222.1 AimR family lysis-lysogeny pheromone receptor [Bacillus paranthracis]MDK7457129.1 AimR family lysis-lysogeny pheromone receptor [Bacillus paranthracis]MDK7519581.1 AimR family lysis-lysogeny pheromone receptor [Bacillus paranthracis]
MKKTSTIEILQNISMRLEAIGISHRKLSEILGISHTTVNKMFSGEREFEFMSLLRTIRILYPNQTEADLRRKTIRHFIVNNKMSPKNTRLAIECLNLLGEYELQMILIHKAKESKDRINKPLVPYYELLSKRNEYVISRDEFHTSVELLRKNNKMTYKEIKIVSDFSLIYSFLDFSNYRMVSKYTQDLMDSINEVKRDNLLYSFLLRKKEMEASVNQRNNHLEKTRSICFELTNDERNIYDGMKANAFMMLGESYAMTDWDKAKKYFFKSLDVLRHPANKRTTLRKKLIQNTFDFWKIYHEEDLDLMNPFLPEEKAFLYTKLGKKQEAKEILLKIQKERGLSAFQKYYMGLATNDKKYFEESIEDFERKGDFFYISLPKNALK